MSTAYVSHFEIVFLCEHPKGLEISQSAAKYMRKSKSFIQKWLQWYKEAKTINDLPKRLDTKIYKKNDKRIVNYTCLQTL